MYALLGKSSSLTLGAEVQIELFNKMVLPLCIYGCEVRGTGKINIKKIEKKKKLKILETTCS